MRQKRKALLAVFCIAALAVGTMAATYAYFTDQEKAVNTFTVGKVEITMDEAKVNPDGTVVAGANRVVENDYHLIPGHTYVKDPTIHVAAKSEECYLYVTVDNQISEIVDATTIEAQMAAKGWEALEGVTFTLGDKNLQVYAYNTMMAKSDAVQDVVIFENFKVIGEGVTNTTIAPFQGKQIVVNAYAIQADGFANAAAAWTAAKGELTN